MDHLSKAKRSWNMRQIRSSDTRPEMAVRTFLHGNGFRYRLKNTLPGKPDIYLKKYGVVVFVHGCFWHCHKGCKRATMPKSNRAYWSKKLESNVARFEAVSAELKRMGLKVLVIWECEVRKRNILTRLVKRIYT